MPTTSEPQLVRAENVTKVFHLRQGLATTNFHAVDDATFTMASDRPEILTIAGESGSGKTTLARMMLGMEKATFGALTYKGRDVGSLSKREKRAWFYREVQPVFQDPFAAFSPLNRIDRYLYETVKNYNMAPKADADQYVDHVLQEVGLSLAEIKGRYPNELSGGQAQRVAVARALITKPSLIVADEPVSMLDASIRTGIIKLMVEMRDDKGIAYLFITHDLSLAWLISDKIAIMYLGKIMEIGSSDQIINLPQHPYTKALLDVMPKPGIKLTEKRHILKGETPSASEEIPGCNFNARCPLANGICFEKEPPMHEVEKGHLVACYFAKRGSGGRTRDVEPEPV